MGLINDPQAAMNVAASSVKEAGAELHRSSQWNREAAGSNKDASLNIKENTKAVLQNSAAVQSLLTASQTSSPDASSSPATAAPQHRQRVPGDIHRAQIHPFRRDAPLRRSEADSPSVKRGEGDLATLKSVAPLTRAETHVSDSIPLVRPETNLPPSTPMKRAETDLSAATPITRPETPVTNPKPMKRVDTDQSPATPLRRSETDQPSAIPVVRAGARVADPLSGFDAAPGSVRGSGATPQGESDSHIASGQLQRTGSSRHVDHTLRQQPPTALPTAPSGPITDPDVPSEDRLPRRSESARASGSHSLSSPRGPSGSGGSPPPDPPNPPDGGGGHTPTRERNTAGEQRDEAGGFRSAFISGREKFGSAQASQPFLSTIGQMAQAAGGRVDSALSNHIANSAGAQYSKVTQDDGTKHWVNTQGEHVADVGADGKAVGAGAGEIDHYLASTSRSGRLAGALASRGGGSLAAGLGMAAARVAGPIGIGYTVASEGIEFAQNQRESNRFYQGISGGTNASGFGQRVQEKMFDLGQMGTMGGAQASALFKGVSQTGLTGDSRNQALNFATDAFRKTGTDVETTMSLINTAVKNGNNNFQALSKGLNTVSDAAKNAGTNVGDAGKQYAENYHAVSQNVTQGGAGAQIATSLTTATARLGPAMKDVNLTPLAGPDNNTIQASLLGRDPTEYANTLAAGGSKAAEAASKGQQAQLTSAVKNLIPPEALAEIQQKSEAAKKENGGKTIAPEQTKQIAADAMTKYHIDPASATTVLQETGIQGLSQGNIQQTIGSVANGSIDLDRETHDAQHPQNVKDIHKIGDQAIEKGGETSKESSAFGDKFTDAGATDQGKKDQEQNQNLLKDMNYTKSQTVDSQGNTVDEFDFDGKNTDAIKQYFKNVHDNGGRSAAAEKLLGKGKEDYSGAKFEVDTKKGKQEVDLKTLISDYGDQISAGTAKVKSGSADQGKTVGEITGISEKVDPASAKNDPAKGASDVKASQGSVEIFTTDKFREYFGINPSGSAVTSGQTTGMPTPLNPPTPGDRPNANNMPSPPR